MLLHKYIACRQKIGRMYDPPDLSQKSFTNNHSLPIMESMKMPQRHNMKIYDNTFLIYSA